MNAKLIGLVLLILIVVCFADVGYQPILAKPRIEAPPSFQIALNTPIKIQVCNDAEIAGGIDVRTEVSGAVVQNAVVSIDVPAKGCSDVIFYVSQTTEGTENPILMSITASSRENIDTKQISLIPHKVVIPSSCLLEKGKCDVCFNYPTYCDFCTRRPNDCPNGVPDEMAMTEESKKICGLPVLLISGLVVTLAFLKR